MEPRPPTRRDATTIAAPPAAEPNGHGGGAADAFSPPTMSQPPTDYQPTAAFDPYTAPESQPQPPYGPTAGYPGDSATRLGPLADEPVFYPNPALPPNRPAYDPVARYDARSEYALHPVGRVPPDHTPLNLRPAPPPVPPQLAPPERNNLIKGILAGVIGLVAVVALIAAVLAFANGGFGGGDDSPPPATVPVVAGQPGDGAAGAAGAASPSVVASPSTSSPAAAGAPVLPGASSAAPSAGASAEPSAGEDASEGETASAAPASDDASSSAEPSAGAGASPSPRASRSASSQASSAGTGGITAFLPPPDDLPAGFDTPSDEGDRSLSEVAGTFVAEGEGASQAEADLEGWGWLANEYVAYDAVPQPANEDINRYAVSVHEFETEDGASEALPAFVDAFGVEPTELPADTVIGDEIVALQTTNDDGNLVVLYVRSGVFLLKIDAASVAGDPLPAALDLAEQLVGS